MSEQTAETPRAPLGRAVVRRLRLPGPPLGAPLPSRIGSLASSVQRFAAATSRPVDVRRALMGPGSRPEEVRPPRWWTGEQPEPADHEAPVRRWHRDARGTAPTDLPDRRLPRAARAVESESSYTPGGMLGRLRGEVVRVRRHEEVVASGSVFSSADRTRMTTAAVRRQPAPPTPGGAPAPIRRSMASAAPAAPTRSGPAASAPSPSSAPSPTAVPSGRHAAPAADVGRPSGADRTASGATPARASSAPRVAASPSTAAAHTAATASPGAPSAPATGASAAPSSPPGVAGSAATSSLSSVPGALPAPAHRSSGAPDAGPVPAPPVASALASGGLAAAAGVESSAVGDSPAAPSAPVLRRASWQLRPRTSRLADVAGRHHAVPSAPPRAAGRLDGRTPDLRRAVAGGSPVAASSVALLDAPPSPAVREGWAATSHVVRRRSLERAEETAAAVAPLRRAGAVRADGRPAAASNPARTASPGVASSSVARAASPATARTGVPAAPPAASSPSSPAPASSQASHATATASSSSATWSPAARAGAPDRPARASDGSRSSFHAAAGGSAPGGHGADTPVAPGASHARPSVHRSFRAPGAAATVAPTALTPLSDLLTIRRSPGRGTGAGPLATGLGEPAEIRPASGNLDAVPAGPGVAPIVRRTATQLADPAAALAAPGRPAAPARPVSAAPSAHHRVEGAVPLLTPALRSPAAPGTTGGAAPGASDAAPGMPGTAHGTPGTAGQAGTPGRPAASPAPGQPVRRSLGRPATVRPPLAAPAGRAQPEVRAADQAALLADPVVRRLLRPPAGVVGAAGGSLLERTAGAFAQDAAAGPAPAGQPPPVPAAGPPPIPASGSGTTIRRTSQGLTMTKTSDWAEQLSAPATPAAALAGPGLSGTALDAVVDAVVERIEQRVVDELERRGRRDGRSW